MINARWKFYRRTNSICISGIGFFFRFFITLFLSPLPWTDDRHFAIIVNFFFSFFFLPPFFFPFPRKTNTWHGFFLITRILFAREKLLLISTNFETEKEKKRRSVKPIFLLARINVMYVSFDAFNSLKQQNFSFLLSCYRDASRLLDESMYKAKESNESEKLDGSVQINLTFRWKACLGQCRVYSYKLQTRESQTQKGRGGGGRGNVKSILLYSPIELFVKISRKRKEDYGL